MNPQPLDNDLHVLPLCYQCYLIYWPLGLVRMGLKLWRLLGLLFSRNFFFRTFYFGTFLVAPPYSVRIQMDVFLSWLVPDLLFHEASRSSETKDGRVSDKKISIINILSIPTIWFSFVTFVVATICNGFLSINLEPKVSLFLKLKKLLWP